MAKSPQEVAKKWQSRTAAATGAYREGIEGVKQAPGKAAAEAVDRMIAKLQQLRDSGELQRRMSSTTLEEWKQACLEKGVNRIGSGVQAAGGKMERFMSEFLPYAESVKQSLPARGGLEDNLQRMLENARKMSEFKRSR